VVPSLLELQPPHRCSLDALPILSKSDRRTSRNPLHEDRPPAELSPSVWIGSFAHPGVLSFLTDASAWLWLVGLALASAHGLVAWSRAALSIVSGLWISLTAALCLSNQWVVAVVQLVLSALVFRMLGPAFARIRGDAEHRSFVETRAGEAEGTSSALEVVLGLMWGLVLVIAGLGPD
jgi:hypothetical protein